MRLKTLSSRLSEFSNRYLKMSRQVLILICILTLYLHNYGQGTASKVRLSPYHDAWGCHMEYSYHRSNSIGLGANYMVEPLHKCILNRRIIYSLDLTLTGIFYKGNFIVGQGIDFGMNCRGISPDIHIFVEHNDKNDLRVGGKLGISYGNFIYLRYQYSLPVGNYENYNISRHGLSLVLKYNWVAVSQLYGP
jgi:hypothetical protein